MISIVLEQADYSECGMCDKEIHPKSKMIVIYNAQDTAECFHKKCLKEYNKTIKIFIEEQKKETLVKKIAGI